MSDPLAFGNTRVGGAKESPQDTESTDWGVESAFGQTMRPMAKGTKVFGRFDLKSPLGKGGMGVVWLAENQRSQQEVALKFIPDLVRMDESAVAELRRETKRGMQMNHPNIVKVFDFMEDETRVAIVMEYIEGGTLAGRLLQQPARIFEAAALRGWVEQLLDALEYTHSSMSLFHRDLKPANLMIGADQQLKVTDFGIACSLRDSASRVSVKTQASGTLLYMSPQQLLGGSPTASDDIYALGATLYELLTSKPPFHGGDLTTQLQTKIPPSMTERRQEYQINGAPIPAAWENAIAACLSKDPGGRPADIAAVRAALKGQPFAYGRPSGVPVVVRQAAPQPSVSAGTQSGTQPFAAPPTPAPKPKWIWGAGAAAALAVIAGGTYLAMSGGGGIAPIDTSSTDLVAKQRKLADEKLADMQKRFEQVKQQIADKDVGQQARQWRKFYDDIKNYSTIYNPGVDELKNKVKKLTDSAEQEVTSEMQAYATMLTDMNAEMKALIADEKQADKSAAAKEQGWHAFVAKWSAAKVPEIAGVEHEGLLQFARNGEQEWTDKARHERQATSGLADLFTDSRVAGWRIDSKEGLLKKVQTVLRSQGLYADVANGEYTPKSGDAIVKYQQKESLPATGKIDQVTLEHMKIVPDTTEPAAPAALAKNGKSSNHGSSGPKGGNDNEEPGGDDKAAEWAKRINKYQGGSMPYGGFGGMPSAPMHFGGFPHP